ncbi:O-antigen ligase family protein [Pseudonocardia sp. CA-142604]|uniref:O-antigen ligase family protein n=1 Tax=Pseudonocardia sp. CA-142604 TaxID=3240024 RepID=UPI003D93EB28
MSAPVSDPSTTPLMTVRVDRPGERRVTAGRTVAVLCMAAVLLEATADLLPDEPVVWVLTPVRLVLGAGLVAAAVAGLRPGQWRTPLDPAIGALLLAAALGTVLAGQPWAAWRGVLTAVAAYYLVVGVRRSVPDAGPAFGLLALVGVAVAGTVAARQAAAGTATGFCRGAIDGSADVCGPDAVIRAVGTFSNPNLLAAFLVLLLPVAAAGAAQLADRTSRLVGTALVVVGYAAVLLTASRGGIVAAVAGAAVFVVLRRGHGRAFPIGGRLRPGRAVVVLLGVGGVVAAGLLLLAPALSVGVRADVWTAAVGLVAQHPLGVGPGRAGALLDAAIAGDEAFQHAHNLWLNWAVEAGVPGLVAVLAITVGTAIVTRRAALAGSATAVAAGAGLAGFAVMSLADHPANAIRVSIAVWIVLALVAAESAPRTLARRRSGQPATGVRSRSGSR